MTDTNITAIIFKRSMRFTGVIAMKMRFIPMISDKRVVTL